MPKPAPTRDGASRPRTTVIIPAHNEAGVIDRCLGALVGGAGNSARIVVVCNGCSDDTAGIARGWEGVEVIETPRPSKVNALNLGLRQGDPDAPVLILDADTELSAASLEALLAVLESDGAVAVSGVVAHDFSRSTRPVRWYYRAWSKTRYAQGGMGGAGVYGVSSAGRGRLREFPDVVADDLYVHSLFDDAERVRVAEAPVRVTPPRTLRDMLRVKTRQAAGSRQLRQHADAGAHLPERSQFVNLVRDTGPRDWPAVAFYAGCMVTVKLRARTRALRGEQVRWERDEASRAPRTGSGR